MTDPGGEFDRCGAVVAPCRDGGGDRPYEFGPGEEGLGRHRFSGCRQRSSEAGPGAGSAWFSRKLIKVDCACLVVSTGDKQQVGLLGPRYRMWYQCVCHLGRAHTATEPPTCGKGDRVQMSGRRVRLDDCLREVENGRWRLRPPCLGQGGDNRRRRVQMVQPPSAVVVSGRQARQLLDRVRHRLMHPLVDDSGDADEETCSDRRQFGPTTHSPQRTVYSPPPQGEFEEGRSSRLGPCQSGSAPPEAGHSEEREGTLHQSA